jgi:phage baseplate assembly protein gpV
MPLIDNRPGSDGGGGGGAVDSVNGQTGVVVLTKTNIGLGNVDNTSDVNKPISTATSTALGLKADQTSISNIDNTSDADKPVSTAQQTALDLKLDLSSSKTYNPNAGSGYNAYLSNYISIDPIANTPLETYAFVTHQITFDSANDGFSLGVGGAAAQIFNIGFNHQGKSDLGQLVYFNCNNDIGNGTDAIAINGITFFNGFMNIDANVTIDGQLQGFGFQPSMVAGSFITNWTNAFTVGANMQTAVAGFNAFTSGNNLLSIQNNVNFNGFSEYSNIPTFTGNSNYTGLVITPLLGTFGTGMFQGINISPTVTSVVNANGIYVSMANVTASGTKYAGYFDGDVNITGALTFGGALSVGQLNAYFGFNLVDGGGNPFSGHSLITQVTAPNGVTTNNYDYLGVNTASLFTAEANSINVAGPLAIGACSLGLPMVIKTETGSVTDVVCGAIFALSMDGTSTGGTITQAIGGRSVVIPNGITTIDRHYGWYADAPFGTIATDNWGVYQKAAEKNYFEGAVKIGGSDVPTAGKMLDVEGDVRIDGTLTVTGGILGVSTVVYKYTLLAGDITAKEITLPSSPGTPADVCLEVIEGIGQDYGIDFTVTGSTLSWDTLGYETLAEIGDKFIVTYKV